jgi:hypothetical protein
MIVPSAIGCSAYGRPRDGNTMCRILLGIAILSMSGLLVDVESFLPASPSATTVVRTTNNHFYHRDFPLDRRHCGQDAQQSKRHRQQQQKYSGLILNSSEDDTNDGAGGGVLESIGLVSQPVVWISLYFVATTGHGLPAGPGGSIGAAEGIAYLVVVVLALLPASVAANKDDVGGSSLPVDARTLSRITIALGLLVLAGVATGKGCVPNAKPILDYSAYLPVCGPE